MQNCDCEMNDWMDVTEAVGSVQIFVRTPSTKVLTLELDPTGTTVRKLKSLVEQREGIPVDAQRLIYQGKQMDDEHVLSLYGVDRHSTIQLVMRLLGGL